MKKSDVWSVGVITYLLVVGRPPFSGRSQKEILSNIIRSNSKKIVFPGNITASCKDFITKLLCHNPQKRLSATEALKHEWIAGLSASTEHLHNDVLDSLKQYHYNNKLQNILINAILTEMEQEEQEILSKGLITMNRQESQVDGTSVVDYLLLHSAIDELPIHSNKEWQAKRMADIRDFTKSQKTLSLPKNENSTHFDGMDWDILEGIDVDTVLAEVDKKEKELGTPYTPNESELEPKCSKTINTNETGTVKLKNNINSEQDSESDSESDFADEEKQDFVSDEEIPKIAKINENYSMRSDRTFSAGSANESVDLIGRRISISRFRAIMDKSNKKYDVDNIVDDLNDGTGHIALKDIAKYNKRIETMSNIFAVPNGGNVEHIASPDSITLSKTV